VTRRNVRRLVRGVLAASLVRGSALAAPAPSGPVEVSFPTEDGGTVFADVYGAGERAVVLAHGARFDKKSWAKQAPALVEAGLRVLALDFRGYGRSTGPGQADPISAPLGEDVLGAVRWLQANGARSVSAVGASMGGGAVAAAAAAAPGAIERMVFLASWPERGAPVERLKGRKLFITARDDRDGSGALRLPLIRAAFEKATEPKRLVLLPGSAHAQFLFDTNEAERLLREIERFLTEP
jgi:pimeloyl-ACP methyl ester carboxylesterase